MVGLIRFFLILLFLHSFFPRNFRFKLDECRVRPAGGIWSGDPRRSGSLNSAVAAAAVGIARNRSNWKDLFREEVEAAGRGNWNTEKERDTGLNHG